jgi:hypothetical protein
MKPKKTPQITPILKSAVMSAAAKKLALNRAKELCRQAVEDVKKMYEEESAETLALFNELESQIKGFLKDERDFVFPGKAKSAKVAGHRIGLRSSTFAVADDAAAAIAALEKVAGGGTEYTPEQRAVAESCLRREVALDLTYIHKHYANHSEWFEAFGLRLETTEEPFIKYQFQPGEDAKP